MKEYIEIKSIAFNSSEERKKCVNYGSQGFYFAAVDDGNGSPTNGQLVFVDAAIENVLFIAPVDLIENMGLIEEKSDKPNKISDISSEAALVNHINRLGSENNELASENRSLRQQLDIVKTMVEPEYNSTERDASGLTIDYEGKIRSLEKKIGMLENENKLLHISDDTKDRELKAAKNTPFSESFVLELTKILTQKAQ